MGTFSLVTLTALVLATIPPLFIAFHFVRVEARILQLFWWLWIILLSGTLIHLLWHLAHPSWRPV